MADQARLHDGQRTFAGIGIIKCTLAEKGYAVLINVSPGSPAERAGLRRHDRNVAVDGGDAGG